MASGPAPQSPACRKGSSAHPGETPLDQSLLSGCKAMGHILHLLTLGAVAGSAKGDPTAQEHPPTPWKGTLSGEGGGSAVPARSRIHPQRCNVCSRNILIRAAFWGSSHMNSFKRPLQEEVNLTQQTSLCPHHLERHLKLDCHTDHAPSSIYQPHLCHSFPGRFPSRLSCLPGQQDVVPRGQKALHMSCWQAGEGCRLTL